MKILNLKISSGKAKLLHLYKTAKIKSQLFKEVLIVAYSRKEEKISLSKNRLIQESETKVSKHKIIKMNQCHRVK